MRHIYFLFILFFLFSASCTVTKEKKSHKLDSTGIVKVDTGRVKKEVTSESKSGEWERQIVIFKDTPINNYYQKPVDYAAIAALINEKGSFNQNRQTNKSDSSWVDSFNYLRLMIEEQTKNKKETVANFWQILSFSLGAGILLLILFIIYKTRR